MLEKLLIFLIGLRWEQILEAERIFPPFIVKQQIPSMWELLGGASDGQALSDDDADYIAWGLYFPDDY